MTGAAALTGPTPWIIGALIFTLGWTWLHSQRAVERRRHALRAALRQWLDQADRRRRLAGQPRKADSGPRPDEIRVPDADWRAFAAGEAAWRAAVADPSPGVLEADERLKALEAVIRCEIAAYNALIAAGRWRWVARAMGFQPVAAQPPLPAAGAPTDR